NFGGKVYSIVAFWISFGISTRTGPGRPVDAKWNADAIASGILFGSVTMKLCLVIGIVTPRISASWKASVPKRLDPTWPVMATIGTESKLASAIGVTKLVAPGPDVAIHTPTLPVATA